MTQKTGKPLALITGASQRLGKQIALEFARMGYAIGLHYYSSEREARITAEEIKAEGAAVFCLQADLRDEASTLDMFSRIKGLPHDLKVLVNSASFFKEGNLTSMSTTEWDETLALNLRAPWLCAREAAGIFHDGKGVIINISDSGASKVWTKYPAYILSKSALETLTRLLARSFAPAIRVNAVAPGLIKKTDAQPIEDWQRLVDRIPLRSSGSAGEIAKAVRFLVENEYITGEILVVDGGYRLI